MGKTTCSVYVWSKYDPAGERKIAECDYGDDAAMLFQSYRKAGYACRVVFHGTMGDEETLKCEAQS